MNVRLVLVILKLFISPKELKVVGIILAVLFALPVIGVVAMAQAPIQAVSDALAFADPVTHMVQIKDANGNVLAELTASTTWPVCGQVMLEFGQPDPPFQLHHTGIDIAYRTGQPITTFMEGTVTRAVTNPYDSRGYGEYVTIDHGNYLTSLYGHMSQVNVTVGQHVKPGDIIGLEGSTGNSTGPHVHFETDVSQIPVNPRTFVAGNPPACGAR